jgi:hypothetical protein
MLKRQAEPAPAVIVPDSPWQTKVRMAVAAAKQQAALRARTCAAHAPPVGWTAIYNEESEKAFYNRASTNTSLWVVRGYVWRAGLNRPAL